MPNKEYPTDDADDVTAAVAKRIVELAKQTEGDGAYFCWSTMGAIARLIECPDCQKKFASVASKIHALAH